MFELACPWVLCLWPLPWLVWFLVPRLAMQWPSTLKVPFFHHIPGMTKGHETSTFKQRKWLLALLIWSLTLVGLAGPRWVGVPMLVSREGHNILMVLDISGSMALTDMQLQGVPISRLAMVKKAAEQFIKVRRGDKIGLILFGSHAYLQTPLTYDHQNVLQRLDDATVGLAGNSTAMGDALGLAVKRLQLVSKEGRVVILLTDGVTNAGVLTPLKAAQLAQEEGIKVYTIGLSSGGQQASFNQLFAQMNASADLDEATLQEIAKLTGGAYFRANDLSSLQHIYQAINSMETAQQDATTIRPQQDYYPWFAAIALLLFFYWGLGGAL